MLHLRNFVSSETIYDQILAGEQILFSLILVSLSVRYGLIVRTEQQLQRKAPCDGSECVATNAKISKHPDCSANAGSPPGTIPQRYTGCGHTATSVPNIRAAEFRYKRGPCHCWPSLLPPPPPRKIPSTTLYWLTSWRTTAVSETKSLLSQASFLNFFGFWTI